MQRGIFQEWNSAQGIQRAIIGCNRERMVLHGVRKAHLLTQPHHALAARLASKIVNLHHGRNAILQPLSQRICGGTVHSISAIGASGRVIALSPDFELPLSALRRRAGHMLRRHDHHPGDAEAVDRHAEPPREERLAERHRDLAAV